MRPPDTDLAALATTDGHVLELHLTPDRPLCLLVRGHSASIALDLSEGERARLARMLEGTRC